jgi:hypothetical protein
VFTEDWVRESNAAVAGAGIGAGGGGGMDFRGILISDKEHNEVQLKFSRASNDVRTKGHAVVLGTTKTAMTLPLPESGEQSAINKELCLLCRSCNVRTMGLAD